jgi:low affinity Fe/Cu permease
MNNQFRKFAIAASKFMGRSYAFVIALVIIIIWFMSGPIFDFSDTWQLVINTGTTIITFLMVFLIQNTQNRESKALHLKLDEIISSIARAKNHMIGAEHFEDDKLDELEAKYHKIANRKS